MLAMCYEWPTGIGWPIDSAGTGRPAEYQGLGIVQLLSK